MATGTQPSDVTAGVAQSSTLLDCRCIEPTDAGEFTQSLQLRQYHKSVIRTPAVRT